MGRSLTGTVIITGGNGQLGSEIAVAIAKTQPFAHILLTARDIKGADVRNLIAKVRLVGPRSIEAINLDLNDLRSVTDFAQSTVERVRRNEIPPVVNLIHSAAIASYIVDELTIDGYDSVYQTNCVAPFFLTIGLLESFRAGDGTPDGGAKVINIGCSAVSYGRLDYFDSDQGRDDRRPGTPMSAKEGNVRYGSSKLLISVAFYALRRSLASVSLTRDFDPDHMLTTHIDR
jgi:mannan polymerase II complex ANP1 subunit